MFLGLSMLAVLSTVLLFVLTRTDGNGGVASEENDDERPQ
jgi:hypothetical protein